MGDQSAIQWTDATWNPVTGCSKISPGCAHCYAERVAIRLWPSQYPPVKTALAYLGIGGPVTRPREFTDVQCHEDRLDQPLRWKKPRKIFVNSMSDLFHEDVPDAFIDRVFAVMALAPQHTFQILTKRAEGMRDYCVRLVFDPERIEDAATDVADEHQLEALEDRAFPLSNVWLGPSIENQAMADKRFPVACELAEAGWNVMVSMEPLLGSVELPARFLALGRKAWVIVGGESGRGARPFDVAWARAIVQQCQAAGVPVFVKQLGAHCHDGEQCRGSMSKHRFCALNGKTTWRALRALRDSHGGDMAEWPEDLRVREFPSREGRV